MTTKTIFSVLTPMGRLPFHSPDSEDEFSGQAAPLCSLYSLIYWHCGNLHSPILSPNTTRPYCQNLRSLLLYLSAMFSAFLHASSFIEIPC